MSNLLIVHELLYGGFQWPSEIQTDVGRISYFARENNISLEDLEKLIDKFLSIYHKKYDSEFVSLYLFKESAQKAIKAKRKLVGELPGVLDTRLTGDGDHEYAAKISINKESGKYSIQIIKKRRDDQFGSMTGVPNAEYWDGTPGQYYVTTLLGWDKYSWGARGDILVIDGGSNWKIYGMNALRDEIEKKYGDEIRKNELHESIKAKKVYENLK